MDRWNLPSGIVTALADVRQFLAGVHLDRPVLLWFGVLPLAFALMELVAVRRAARRWQSLGTPGRLAVMQGGTPRRTRVPRMLLSIGFVAAVIGLAGPRWGIQSQSGVTYGRDIVLVIDLSRSMLADDVAGGPTRWQAAVAGATGLIDELKAHGGHRLAVVVFAARPKVLVPLTSDLDHLRIKLNEINGRYPPAEIRPADDSAKSGTRLGTALIAAVAQHSAEFRGYQEILLFSDGDDPAVDADTDWKLGINAARAAGIPVHPIGLGDPQNPSLILIRDRPLEFPGENGIPDPVRTQLQEKRLTEIAIEGRGQYLPARRSVPDVVRFLRTAVEPNPSREMNTDPLPTRIDRSTGFYVAGFLGFGLGWLLHCTPLYSRPTGGRLF